MRKVTEDIFFLEESIERTLHKFVSRNTTWKETVEELHNKGKALFLSGLIIGVVAGLIVG